MAEKVKNASEGSHGVMNLLQDKLPTQSFPLCRMVAESENLNDVGQ